MTFAPRMTDSQRSKWMESKYVALGAMVVGLAVGVLVDQFAQTALADAVGSSTCAIIYAGYVLWDERERVWFLCFMTTVVLAHGIALIAAPWPRKHWSPVVYLAVIGDALVIVLLGLSVRRLIRKTNAPQFRR